jgi:DNA-binding response OmpR family regulator
LGQHGRLTVLIIDDQPEVRRIIRATLTRNGFEILEADSGAEGLHIARSHPGEIQLAIIDLVMPGLGGMDTGTQLRTERPNVRILYASGYADSVAVESLARGAPEAILTKPFTQPQLIAKVKALLEPAGERPEAKA